MEEENKVSAERRRKIRLVDDDRTIAGGGGKTGVIEGVSERRKDTKDRRKTLSERSRER